MNTFSEPMLSTWGEGDLLLFCGLSVSSSLVKSMVIGDPARTLLDSCVLLALLVGYIKLYDGPGLLGGLLDKDLLLFLPVILEGECPLLLEVKGDFSLEFLAYLAGNGLLSLWLLLFGVRDLFRLSLGLLERPYLLSEWSLELPLLRQLSSSLLFLRLSRSVCLLEKLDLRDDERSALSK